MMGEIRPLDTNDLQLAPAILLHVVEVEVVAGDVAVLDAALDQHVAVEAGDGVVTAGWAAAACAVEEFVEVEEGHIAADLQHEAAVDNSFSFIQDHTMRVSRK